jgi:hypothetical protein
MASKLKSVWVIVIVLVLSSAFVIWRLALTNWNPVALAEIGTRFSEGDPNGTAGYDGQFNYYIAIDPNPNSVAAHLDVPAYRYQHILYPLLARALALGNEALMPWMLIGLNIAAHLLGTWAVTELLVGYGVSPWYGLIYGLWVGLIASVGIDLSEPLAYALVAVGWLARRRGWPIWGAAFLGLALFAKETCAPFLVAAVLAGFFGQGLRRQTLWIAAMGLPFLAWQIYLWVVFGRIGLGLGGDMATPLEWIPFMGLLRVGGYSLLLLGAYLIMFGPTVVMPTIWGIVAPIHTLLGERESAESWALLLNAAIFLFLPFAAYREPLGLVRLATGLVLGVLLFAACQRRMRPLNLGFFWCAMLVILVRQ